MEARFKELARWDGSAALLFDGGSGPPERPPLHLQAAAGGYLRLVGPEGPVLWGLVDSGSYGVEIVRAKNAAVHAVPPIRADDAATAPGTGGSIEFLNWWTRRYAKLLAASSNTPLARGRHHLLACGDLALRPAQLEDLLEQREDFEFSWDGGYVGLLLTRQLSDASDGRVKMWRKRAKDGTLPPLLTWWCRGLFAHVLLDGHDRVHAALLEGTKPDVIVLADATASAKDAVEERRETAVEQATFLETIPSVTGRASATNMILRTGWDPRAEWELATPGFPLDGGVEQWKQEVHGTSIAKILAAQDAAEVANTEP